MNKVFKTSTDGVSISWDNVSEKDCGDYFEITADVDGNIIKVKQYADGFSVMPYDDFDFSSNEEVDEFLRWVYRNNKSKED